MKICRRVGDCGRLVGFRGGWLLPVVAGVAGGIFLAVGECQVNCRLGWAGSLAEDVSCWCRRLPWGQAQRGNLQ